LFSKQVIAQATLDTYARNLETAKQTGNGAQAEEDRARLAYTSNIGGVNTSVARLTAELSDAQFDLDQAVTRAPSHGFVTQVTLRPGMYVVPIPLKPVMAFINTDPKDKALIGAFWQNSVQRVKSGDQAEVAFAAVPGRVFKGKVGTVVDAIPNGQLPPSGTMLDFGEIPQGGRALATIDLTDDLAGYNIPLVCAVGKTTCSPRKAKEVAVVATVTDPGRGPIRTKSHNAPPLEFVKTKSRSCRSSSPAKPSSPGSPE
jgi:multidrug efflux pump subunit AcrA (membrane-fusion protein)